MDYQNIQYESLERVARISHARPQRRNAQNVELLDELDHALQRGVADPDIRVIVIAGQGDHFSAGHDLKDAAMHRRQITPEDRYEFEDERYLGYCLRLWDAPKPVIAQVQGACIAAGFMVANMCDLIVAADDAFFADPVVNSFGAAAVEVLVHPWAMGLRQAKQFLYTGGRMSAQEAHAIGMVNQVVPRAELETATLALAGKIAESSSFALRLIKRSLNRTADIQGFRAALNAHFDTHQLSHMSTEAQQRQAAGFDATIQSAKARVA
ncbi:enoyl-CoA hydratase [Trinickia violacea]|uniref:Enoyl-CoA hydratase n=1 Tax=Trinickia violacea TaxID=2571746 RepID=A0A4P8ITI8_9BURK|nr:enoyl-CoA hydratase [Trinickia violacea]QCP50374.1 enoyl-CoA hydratase [Trinickia violacea]